MLDYVAVEEPDPAMLAAVGEGLRRGAEEAGVEIPGGELAVMPELIRGHPSPRGLDLLGFCVGLVDLDRIVTGAAIEPGDALVGLPSSGVHSNGLTLARRALPDLAESPPELGGATVGEALLEPTVIYVRAVLELLESDVDVRGLAHITGDGLLNLLRLEADVGYRIDAPLPPQPVFGLIAERGDVPPEEMYEVFNMGCGFVAVVPAGDADAAVELLGAAPPGRGGDRLRHRLRRDRRTAAGRAGRRPRRLPRGRLSRQASSQSQPVSTRSGLTFQSTASAHSSACARGPGRSQTASTSARGHPAEALEGVEHARRVGSRGLRAGGQRGLAVRLVGLRAEDPAVVAEAQRREHERRGPRALSSRSAPKASTIACEARSIRKRSTSRPALRASSTSASLVSSLRRKHISPSRSDRR